MKFFLALFLAFIVVFLGIQIYRLYGQQGDLATEHDQLTAQASAIAAENQKFSGDINYFKDDQNLTKELQSKFNYRKPDEKMYLLSPATPAN